MKKLANCNKGIDTENRYSVLHYPASDYNMFLKDNSENEIKYADFISLKTIGNGSGDLEYVAIGNAILTFKANLKNIVAQIEEAKEILSYAPDWDGENGEPTDEVTFLKAANFLHKYSCYIERNFGVILTTPYFDLLKDGSVYINWELKNAKFLIIFKKHTHPLAYFYAERKDKKGNILPFKSAIEIDGDVDEVIAQWVKTYLS